MKKRTLFMLLALVACCMPSLAHDVVIDCAEMQAKTVKQILFEGEDVTLVFDDNSTQKCLGSLYLNLANTTGLSEMRYYDAASIKFNGSGTLNVNGLDPKLPITLYSASGQVVMRIAAPNAETVSIDVSRLTPGVYMIASGVNTIRFVKQ